MRQYINLIEAVEKGCPRATFDIDLNLKNRQTAIDEYTYGPANPDKPGSYWKDMSKVFKVDEATAKSMMCGNCAAFDVTTKTLDCIATGIGDDEGTEDPFDVIKAGKLGYCRMLKFKCAAARTCDAWVVGGPITDDKTV
jgi:hypothetical protein